VPYNQCDDSVSAVFRDSASSRVLLIVTCTLKDRVGHLSYESSASSEDFFSSYPLSLHPYVRSSFPAPNPSIIASSSPLSALECSWSTVTREPSGIQGSLRSDAYVEWVGGFQPRLSRQFREIQPQGSLG
jgi:hypothetical protein